MDLSEKTKENVRMYQANDYEIDRETPSYLMMKKNTASILGHVLVFIFFGWWTLGLANLIYWYACKKEKKVMKEEDDNE